MSTYERAAALAKAQRMPLPQAAGFLAANGWPLFPCKPGGKTPLTTHGLSDATTDAQQVERWWARWPSANIAVPTGPASGFEVVDVDVREDKSGYGAFHAASAKFRLDKWSLRVQTPSGGMHFFYPARPERGQRNWVAASAAVDFRGAGGYVIVPPSRGVCDHEVEASYSLISVHRTGRPIDATALREFLDPEYSRRRLATVLRRPNQAATVPGRLADWVAALPEGERNTGLFWASCRLVEAGHPIEVALNTLVPAAATAGLVQKESVATIRSAFRHTRPLPKPPEVAQGPVPMGAVMVWNR